MKELTNLIVAATEYLRSITLADGEPLASTTEQPAAEPKKKTRKKKAAPAAAVQTNGASDLTPETSMNAALELATAFVSRFKKATPDGVARAKTILAEQFKVGKIGDLIHDQRVEFITTLTAEMEKPV